MGLFFDYLERDVIPLLVVDLPCAVADGTGGPEAFFALIAVGAVFLLLPVLADGAGDIQLPLAAIRARKGFFAHFAP